MPTKKTTTEKGLGWKHRQEVENLRLRHKDGSPCEWCGRPLWLDDTKNYDYNPHGKRRGNGRLQGDHSGMCRSDSLRRGEKVLPPDRLLHAQCNRERGTGINDHRSASYISTPNSPDRLAMPWPWL